MKRSMTRFESSDGPFRNGRRTAAFAIAAMLPLGAACGPAWAGQAEADFNDLYLGPFRTAPNVGEPNYGNLGTGTGLTNPDYNLNTAYVLARAGDLSVPAAVANFTSSQGVPVDPGAPSGISAANSNMTSRYRRQQLRGVVPQTGNRVWFSFLYSLLGPDSELKVVLNSTVNGTSSEVNSGGVAILAGDNDTPGELAIALPNTGQPLAQIPAGERHPGVAWDGAPHVLLGRIDVNDAGDDVVSIWLDPADALSPGVPSLVKTGECVNASGVTNFGLQIVTEAVPSGGPPPTDGGLILVDLLRISDENTSLYFVTGNSPPPLPDLVVAGDSPAPNYLFGTVFLPNPVSDTATRTVRYLNDGSASITIQGVSLANDGGGAFTIASAPATPFALNVGQSFEVRIAAGGGGGAGGGVHSGLLHIDTDHANSGTVDLDRDETIQATIYATGDPLVLNANPSLDTGQNGWTDGAGGDSVAGIVTGSVQCVRVKGEGDPAGANPDNFGQVLPKGYGDFRISFWFAIASFPEYLWRYAMPDERAIQYVIHADADIPQDASGVWTNAHADSAMVSLGYLPSGTTADPSAGFFVFDGPAATWTRLPGLGTILDSSDVDLNGTLRAADGDLINAFQLTITGHGFGQAGATYDISISDANTTNVAYTVSGITTRHAVDLAAQTPGAHVFTTGDRSSGSNPSLATSASFWIDEVYATAADSLPVARLAVTPPPAEFRVVEGSTTNGLLTLANTGIGADLAVTGIGFSDTNFFLTSGTVPASVPWSASADYGIRFDATALAGEQVIPVAIAVATANGVGQPTQTVSSAGLVYRAESPLFNGSFEFAGADPATDNDTFLVWAEQGTASRIMDVPGLVTGSTTAAYIDRVETPAVQFGRMEQTLLREAADFDLDLYFAVQDTTNRQFYLQLYGPRSGSARVTLRYQASEGGWHAYTDAAGWQLVMGNTVLAPSIDVDGNHSLNDPGDTRNVYRLRVRARDWDTAAGYYDLEVFDAAGASVDSAASLTIFREAEPMGVARVQFTTEYGNLPGYWIDDISMTVSGATPPAATITRFAFDPPTRTVSLRWTDTGGAYAVAIGDDLTDIDTNVTVNGTNGQVDTNSVPGEIRFDFVDPYPDAPIQFLRINATPP